MCIAKSSVLEAPFQLFIASNKEEKLQVGFPKLIQKLNFRNQSWDQALCWGKTYIWEYHKCNLKLVLIKVANGNNFLKIKLQTTWKETRKICYMTIFVTLKHKVNLINLRFPPKYFRIMTIWLIFENQNSLPSYSSTCWKMDYFYSIFRFTAKLSRKYREFPCTPCLHTHSLPHCQHPAPFVAVNEPTLTHLYHPKSTVYITRIYSGYWEFYGFWQRYDGMYPPL